MSTTPSSPTDAADARRRMERRTLRRVLLIGIPLALALLCLVPNVGPVFRLFNIPAASMAPTLPLGSLALVSRASYGYSRTSFDAVELPINGRFPALVPARGDVVAFRLPSDHGTFYIKRVIGLPGDRVAMRDGRLVLNGSPAPRDRVEGAKDPFGEQGLVPAYVEHLPGGASHGIIETEGDAGALDNTQEIEVPVGHLFLMGDNRDNSNDSRLSSMGVVPLELVLGRVIGVR